MTTPFGYAARRTWQGTACALHASAMACTLVLACNELVFNLPAVFFSADLLTPTTARAAAVLLGFLLGAWLGYRLRRHAYGLLFEASIGLALLLQVAPWLYWLGLDGRCIYWPLFWGLPALSALGLATFGIGWFNCAFTSLHRHMTFDALVTPHNTLLSALFALAMAMTLPFGGHLLHGSCLASAMLALGACAASPKLAICSSNLGPRQRIACNGLLIVVLGVSAATALRLLPLRAVHDSPHPIVHYETGTVSDLKVTSTQGAFHVFNSGRLRFSTLDQGRWAEALTRPALSRADCPKRALVMSMGEGLIERELLRDRCILSIDSVVRDAITLGAARREPWWRELTHEAWRSARVHARVVDPAQWVTSAPSSYYELLVVDMPDPDDFVNVKYFTRYFYRQLKRCMVPNGVLVVQATSALRSPNTFASIQSTLRSAGFATVAYRVAMTTLGEWSFLLAQQTSIGPVRRPEWLSRSALGAAEAFALAPDATPMMTGQISRLNDPAALEAFLNEGGDHAP